MINLKKVVVCGCFDLLHPGHLFFFKEAKKHGDSLTVLVARDSHSIREHGLIFDESTRRQMVSELKIVDEVVLGDSEDKIEGVLKLKPDVIVLGYDQKFDVIALEKAIKEKGLSTKIIRLEKAFHPDEYKSRIIKQKLKELV